MSRDVQLPTTNEHGDEIHPAFGLIGASRGQSTPGQILFDSDIRHSGTIRIRIKAASRKRSLSQDRIHGGKEYIEVELSEAQWASFVSTMNSGDGVPCTIRHIDQVDIPELPYAPRLAETMAETHDAAQKAYGAIQEAMERYEALIAAKAPAKEIREARGWLRSQINNATSNVDFAGKQLVEQSENVVQRARADIEAFVINKAGQLGLDPGTIDTMPELGVGDS